MTPGSICSANKFWLTHMSSGKKKRTKINKCIKTCYKNIKKKNEVKKSEEKVKLHNLNLTFFNRSNLHSSFSSDCCKNEKLLSTIDGIRAAGITCLTSSLNRVLTLRTGLSKKHSLTTDCHVFQK